jgi:hypothetical protein
MDTLVYALTNLNTGISTNLQDLLPNWHLDFGNLALSDTGQILVYADNQSTNYQAHALLLTPAGLSSTPIAAPEPSAFVTLAVAGVTLVVRRRWKSSKAAAI